MRASQLFWTDLSGWVEDPEQPRGADADLVLCFYGEMPPHDLSGQMQLHSQTMTATPISELAA